MVGRGIDVQNENEVLLARRIDHGDSVFADNRGWRASRERSALEFLNVARAVTLEARCLTIILDTDNELASRRVGECTNMLRNLLVILASALSIEVLILLRVENRITSFVAMGCCTAASLHGSIKKRKSKASYRRPLHSGPFIVFKTSLFLVKDR